jgi:betaine-aldehyde dehydrogenase
VVEAWRGVAEGAVLRRGGPRPDRPDLAGSGRIWPDLADGIYYLPTVLDECTAGMSGSGGVLRAGPHRRALHERGGGPGLANDTVYGLAGTVWTGDEALAARGAAGLRLGTVWINDYHPSVPQAEWGGFKQSGFGRELGPAGLAEYRETKHIWRNTRPTPQGWFD